MIDVSGARLSPITCHRSMRRWDSTSYCSCGAHPHRPAVKTPTRPGSVPRYFFPMTLTSLTEARGTWDYHRHDISVLQPQAREGDEVTGHRWQQRAPTSAKNVGLPIERSETLSTRRHDTAAGRANPGPDGVRPALKGSSFCRRQCQTKDVVTAQVTSTYGNCRLSKSFYSWKSAGWQQSADGRHDNTHLPPGTTGLRPTA